MSALRYVADASGVARRIKYRFRCDSGGVVRQIKYRYVADSNGVPRLTYVLGDLLTLVAGTSVNNSGGNSYGYYTAGSVGSLTPHILGDGANIYELLSNQKVDVAAGTPGYWTLALGGPSIYNASNPLPQSYINEIMVFGPGVNETLTGASAQFVRVNADQAGWGWGPGLPAFTPGDTYQVIVMRSDQ